MEPVKSAPPPTEGPAVGTAQPEAAASAEAGPSTAATTTPSTETKPAGAGPKRRLDPHDPSLEPMSEVMLRRLTTIQAGDNVLLKLPSDSVKAVVASKEGLVQLGKFGSFPASLLLGLHYDITYEVYPNPDVHRVETIVDKHGARAETALETAQRLHTDKPGKSSFGQAKAKKGKKGKEVEGSGGAGGGYKTNPGWNNLLRPLRRGDVVDAIVEDIVETNEFIDDIETGQELMPQEEILKMRAQGMSVDEIMQAQIARHERFDLKTDFSKEKWKKRKEKKYSQAITPISPSAHNMTNHYFARSPQNILSLREDTLSQLLTLSNVRPGGRYLIVDDTGGLVTAAVLERMGSEGRIMTFNEADSPPAWGVLNVMNFSERELGCIKWLNWLEASEDYEKPPLPDEVDMPAVSEAKNLARQKKHSAQIKHLNDTRRELHSGNWDGLILATDLNPIHILERLHPYLSGSATITLYSPHLQILAETLQFCRADPGYLNANLTESWSRTYQVLPGRTHPLMTTSATGGYLLHTTKVYVHRFEPASHVKGKRRQQQDAAKRKKAKANEAIANGSAKAVGEGADGGEDDDDLEEVPVQDETEI